MCNKPLFFCPQSQICFRETFTQTQLARSRRCRPMNGSPGTMHRLCWSPWAAATQHRLPSTETPSEANRSSPRKTLGLEPPRPLLALLFLAKRQKRSRHSHGCLSETVTEVLRGRRKRRGNRAVHIDVHEWKPWTDLCIASSFFSRMNCWMSCWQRWRPCVLSSSPRARESSCWSGSWLVLRTATCERRGEGGRLLHSGAHFKRVDYSLTSFINNLKLWEWEDVVKHSTEPRLTVA